MSDTKLSDCTTFTTYCKRSNVFDVGCPMTTAGLLNERRVGRPGFRLLLFPIIRSKPAGVCIGLPDTILSVTFPISIPPPLTPPQPLKSLIVLSPVHSYLLPISSLHVSPHLPLCPQQTHAPSLPSPSHTTRHAIERRCKVFEGAEVAKHCCRGLGEKDWRAEEWWSQSGVLRAVVGIERVVHGR